MRKLPEARKALGALMLMLVLPAWAADYPTKPVRLIVPYPAGGGTDYMARAVAQKLSEPLGQPVIVDNRPAVDGVIGTATVATARPDGYTLLLVSSSHAINAALGRKLPYDTLKDFEPIIQTANQQLVLVAHPSVQVKSVKELVSLAQAKPDALNYGSSSNATVLPMELFKSMTKTRIQHVPYKGSAPMLNDLIGGQIQLSMAAALAALPHVKGGRLTALGMSGATRSAAMPDLPTIAEAGVTGYEATIWTGILAPAKTPRAIVTRINSDVGKLLSARDLRERS
ncbi:MAG TPA: tripartite tricarboxylate transporter substrate binding protein [Burkholderiales bacterium]|nr:tripartite tricarboxylate transporter substrate binding protein [Burkholderiales bacterium]